MSRFPANTLIGIASLCLGILVFSLQDAIIKALSGSYAVTEAVFIRAVVALPILAAFTAREAGLRRILTPHFWPLTLRGAMLFVAYTLYYMAFPALPLAVAVALFFISPLLITLLAAVFLEERVGIVALGAVLLGFAGVLVMTNPGTALFEPAVLLSLGSAFFYSMAMVLARRYSGQEKTSVMTFYQNGVYLVLAAAVAGALHVSGITQALHPSLDFLVRPWVMPTLRDFLLLASCGVIAAVAMFLLTHAYRMAEANLVTVFEYTGMVWAPLWGFLFFSEVPELKAVTGTAMIMAAGLIVLLRRRKT